MTIKINGIEYERRENGYCYKTENGKAVRIGKAEFEQAQAEAEKANAKKSAKKAKRAKNAAFKATIILAEDKIADVTLTNKQVDFLNGILRSDEFVQGAESTFYTDFYCDTMAEIMNAMVVGAIISTLREKDLIYVAQGRVNGKKCKYFGFTDLGKAIIKEMGLV